MKKMGLNVQEMWDNYKMYDIMCHGDTWGEESSKKEKGTEEIFKATTAENCLKLMSETKS